MNEGRNEPASVSGTGAIPVPAAPPTTPGVIAKPTKPVRPDAHLRPPAWVRWWSRIDLVLAALWLVWTADQASNIGLSGFPAVGIVLAGLYLAGAWCVRTIALLAWIVRRKPGPVRTLRPAIAVVCVPIVGMIGVAFESTMEDTALRVRLSEGALRAEAESMRAGNAFSGPGWYGAFRVHGASLDGDEVRFITKRGFLFDEYGVVLASEDDDAPEPEAWYASRTRLGGGWSAFRTHD